MRLIFKQGRFEIWESRESYGSDFYVYGVTVGGDALCVPSLGMAQAKIAAAMS